MGEISTTSDPLGMRGMFVPQTGEIPTTPGPAGVRGIFVPIGQCIWYNNYAAP